MSSSLVHLSPIESKTLDNYNPIPKTATTRSATTASLEPSGRCTPVAAPDDVVEEVVLEDVDAGTPDEVGELAAIERAAEPVVEPAAEETGGIEPEITGSVAAGGDPLVGITTVPETVPQRPYKGWHPAPQ